MEKATVHWIDAQVEGDDMPIEGALDLKPLIRENAGYLLEESEEKVILAFGLIKNPNKDIIGYDKILVIPRSMVTEIEK
jgi:hypothetical protein